MPESDWLDTQILELLAEDGRRSYSELARQLGIPRVAIAKRMREMTESGDLIVVAVPHPKVLPSRDVALLRVLVGGEVTAVIKALVEDDATLFVTSVVGHHNITAECRLDGPEDLSRLVEVLRSAGRLLSVEVSMYSRILRGAIEHPDNIEVMSGLDQTDYRILKLLAADGRLPFVVLAEQTGLSASAVRRRVDRLARHSALKFVPVLRRSSSSLPIAGFGVSGHADNEALKERLLSLDHLNYFIECVGSYDLMGTIIAPSQRELARALSNVYAAAEPAPVRTWYHLEIHKETHSQSVWR